MKDRSDGGSGENSEKRPEYPSETDSSSAYTPESSTQVGEGPPPSPPPPPDRSSGGSGNGEDGDEDSELGGRMTFLEHLDELRRRILYSILALVVTFIASWIFREEIFAFLAAPIHDVVEELHVIKPTEPFTIYLKVSFVAGLFLAIPVILYQVWMFIAPGLYRKEKHYVFPFLLCSTVLFLLGGSFAYWIVLPPALRFLLLEFGRGFRPIITAVEYFDFEIIIVVGMGVIFQLPVLVAFLSIFGMITPRFLWKNFRYAFLIITIIAAIVSPTTDPFNLFLWTGPMVILYMVSIAVSWIFKRRRERDSG